MIAKENQIYHDSAIKHVSGKSVYINDMDVSSDLLFGKVVYSPFAHAKILSVNIDKALQVKGVHSILNYKDIPGINQMGPVFHDEVCLAENEVHFIGQAVLLIAAESMETANKAAKLIEINYEQLPAITTLEEAIANDQLLSTPRIIKRGNAEEALQKAKHIIKGCLKTGAQEHWYLETQSSLCIPGELNEMMVYSSTQNPNETQAIVAEVLGIPKNEVVVEVRRMGGAFGGKETQGNHTAAWAAILAMNTNRPVKIHLFRDDDQIMTGKRHRFISDYEIGFDDEGLITAYKVNLNADAGATADLSMAILERAVLHADNSYYIPDISVTGKAWKTNLPSNTAFRGFGGPQGMAVIENAIDSIARFLKKDATEIRFKNFYGINERNYTHYDEEIEHNRLFTLYEQLIKSSDYYNRKKEIQDFNKKNEFYKKGIALTPVKFGISFTTAFLNQAGALVNIYQDGTVLVNHGGTEMGQGLHTKMQQIAAVELGISPEFVKVNATNTSKVPNASATAASSGSDMNGMAVKNAIDTIKIRLIKVVLEEFNKDAFTNHSKAEDIVFKNNLVFDKSYPERNINFKKLIKTAYLQQKSLSSTGYYKTPNIFFDRETGKGHPFHYYAFGMAVSEVKLDILTAQLEILRTDILHDTGKSINEGIDFGQIEGGFIQGVGWCTSETIKWDDKGKLLNHSPDTYKIPTIQDIPKDFRTNLLKDVPNYNTIHHSKAIGEPPLMLAFSVWLAIKDAISAVGNHKIEPDFELPASNEVILKSIEKIKKSLKLEV
ncbi:MAG: xanthine dehydrogenase molybdopterin binding subunit [Bacteroidetes bacterium]|nr:xanthine dehydrogenase molybdopterin binding subunit [Bacteroidota bacterium]